MTSYGYSLQDKFVMYMMITNCAVLLIWQMEINYKRDKNKMQLFHKS
jgi:hypothetical protein